MYKVLIADDNALIRKSILKRVPWQQLDMECVGEAENGRDTAQLIEKLQPDIVITDIKMPVADGFYAIEATKDRFPHTQFIIISGYDDFAYLKQSIQFQVLNYILKPINTDELIESLKKAAEQCGIRRSEGIYKNLYDRHQVDNAFSCFLSGELDFHSFANRLAQLDYPLLNTSYQCICLNWATDHPCTDLFSSDECESLEKKLEELCYPSSCRILVIHHNTLLAVFAHVGQSPLSGHLKQTVYACAQNYKQIDAPLYLSCTGVLSLKELPQLYLCSLQSLFVRFIRQQGVCHSIIFQELTSPIPVCPSHTWIRELTLAFELQLYGECQRLIRKILQDASLSWENFCGSVPQLLDCLDQGISQVLGRHIFIRQNRELYVLLYSNCSSLSEDLCHLIDQLPHPEKMDLGQQAVSYIHGNYRSPLTLQELGEIFYVNQIYLGQVIKKTSGKSFNSLLNELRLEEAARIIRKEPEISLSVLALSLGYTDAHYFTKVFKRYYGQTPSDLKRNTLHH